MSLGPVIVRLVLVDVHVALLAVDVEVDIPEPAYIVLPAISITVP